MEGSRDLNELSVGSINLMKLLPTSKRWIYRRLTPYAFWVVVSAAALTASRLDLIRALSPRLAAGLQPVLIALLIGTLLIFIFKYLSLKIGSKRVRVGIEGEHLVLARGIFFQQRGAYPLARITDVYIHRDPLDLLFGLYNLQISTPTSASSQFAQIRGLTKDQAMKLQEILLSYLDRSHFMRNEPSEVSARRLARA